MLKLTVSATDGQVLASTTGEDEVVLHSDRRLEAGTVIALSTPPRSAVWLTLDRSMPPALLYLPDGLFVFPVPGADQSGGYAPHAFDGAPQRLHARLGRAPEMAERRDLALNPLDHAESIAFPHAEATIETRGEAGFAARCAIDGEMANDGHGCWPHTSWGIGGDPKASLTIRFGRPVVIDEIALTLRADFPHDSWWCEASVSFDGDRTERLPLLKSAERQGFAIAPAKTCQLVLHDLKRADDPSPFPALTRIEAMGKDAE